MGIMDFIKQGVQEMMIARPDDKKNLVVWKHPENTIPTMSQLTVAADECVVFFRDGAQAGLLHTAGVGARHTLSTQNIPFLSRFVDSFTGANIFKTDLFFVTTRPMRENFGDSLGMVEDPALGIAATPRVFGQFAFQIADPVLFVTKYNGIRRNDSNDDVLKWVKGLLLQGVKQTVAWQLDTFAKESDPPEKGLLNLLSMQTELAERFVKNSPDLADIGVQLLQVGNFNINLGDEEYKELKAAQSELGEAKRAIRKKRDEARAKQFELDQRYSQDSRYVQNLAGGNFAGYAAGQAMLGAGEGMAKGGSEGGAGPMAQAAGLGAGFAMAQAMGQSMNTQAQHAPAAAPVAPGLVNCGACSASVPGGKFCAECGATLAPKPRFCASCGTKSTGEGKFCMNCGTAFGTAT